MFIKNSSPSVGPLLFTTKSTSFDLFLDSLNGPAGNNKLFPNRLFPSITKISMSLCIL